MRLVSYVNVLVLIGIPHFQALSQQKEILEVAVYDSPPFGFMINDTTFSGLMVELWEEIADELDVEFQYHLTDMDGVLSGLRAGFYDVGLGAISVTPKREEIVDFSQPVNPSGTGIGVLSDSFNNKFWLYWRPILIGLLRLIGSLMVILVISGTLVWMLERKRNPNHFKRNLHGLGDGLWWAAVTMATVGYGDKVPVTRAGRLIAIIWIFISIVLVSLFTANASSIFTTTKIESRIQTREDLMSVRVGAAKKSSGEEYLIREHVPYVGYNDIDLAIKALINDEIDAVVSNVPVLKYYKHTKYSKQLAISSKYLLKNNMAIALSDESKLREGIDRALLKKIAESKWQEKVYKYFGKE